MAPNILNPKSHYLCHNVYVLVFDLYIDEIFNARIDMSSQWSRKKPIDLLRGFLTKQPKYGNEMITCIKVKTCHFT